MTTRDEDVKRFDSMEDATRWLLSDHTHEELVDVLLAGVRSANEADARIAQLTEERDEAWAQKDVREKQLVDVARERHTARREVARLQAALREERAVAIAFLKWLDSAEGVEAMEAFPALESHEATFARVGLTTLSSFATTTPGEPTGKCPVCLNPANNPGRIEDQDR